MVKAGFVGSGSWAIDVTEAGKYEIVVTRWPIELGAPISGKVDGGVAIVATKVRLLAGTGELSKEVPEGATKIRFEVDLPAGSQRLQAWLVDDTKDEPVERGAYFVYIKRL